MTYKILSTRNIDVTVFTNVEYNFDGVLHTVEIPHFMPKSQDEILQNIINAAPTELEKLQAKQLIQNILPSIPLNIENSID